MEILILFLIIYILIVIFKRANSLRLAKKLLKDPVYVQTQEEAVEFLNDVEKLKNDYFNYSKKVILKNKYKSTYAKGLNVKKHKGISDNHINEFLDIYDNLDSLINVWNDEYVKKELTCNADFFSNIDEKSLDDQQRKAVVVDEDNNLIIAGAGSGKTLTIAAKVKYLIDKKNINPNKILLMSFTGKSAEEMKERINNRLNISAEVRTFHSLGFSIINQSKSKKPDVYEDIDKIINDYLNKEVINDKKAISKLINFFGYYLNIPTDLEKYENLGEVYENTKNLDLETIKSKVRRKQEHLRRNKITLKSETVRSLEEVTIANYLYLNGINYEYEKAYPYDNDKNNRKVYRPDFYLPDYDIYIEHFGITRDYKTPWLSEIESKKYIESIYWKRDVHKAKGTLLLETYSYMNKEGILLSDLKKMLIKNNVMFKPIDYLEVYRNLFVNSTDKYIGEFKKLIKTFIGLFKSNGYTSNKFIDLRKSVSKIESAFLKQRAVVFLDIIEPLFDYYTEYLQQNRKIDFNDMINMATNIVNTKSVSLDYDYIIIDEYQDISMSRFNLIKEIKIQTNAKVIAVGDDWQSIYRFAGSDINLFTNFEKYLGVTEILKIEKTYRNSQELVDVASKFVMQNSRQIKKRLTSNKHNSNPVRILGYEFNVIEAFGKAIDEIVYLNGEEAEILLLGRNNFDVRLFRDTKEDDDVDEDEEEDLTNTFKPIETDLISIKKHDREYKIVYKKYPKLKINFLSVHRSKGLESDNVIILNLTNNLFGFPNRLTDDPILSLVITDLDDFDYAEERRLFYVAITRTKNVTYLLAPQFNQSVFTDELIRKQNIEFDTSMISEPVADNPTCPVCEKGFMVLRENSNTNNKFLGCTNYPLCNNTFKEIEILNNQITCNVCGGYMVRRNGTYGEFYGCTNYPECRNTIRIEKDFTETNNETPNKGVTQDGLSPANHNLNEANNKIDNSINRKDVNKSNNENKSKFKDPFTDTISNQIEGEYHSLDNIDNIKSKKSKSIKENKKRIAFDTGSEVQHNAFGIGTVVNNDTKIITVLFEDEKLVKLSLETCINSNILVELNNVSQSTIDSLKKESDEAEKLGKYTKQTLNINQKIVQSGCKDTEYYLRLARCYVKFNNIDEAVDLYTSILRFSPDNEEAKDFLLFYGKGSIMNSKDPGKKKSMQYYKF